MINRTYARRRPEEPHYSAMESFGHHTAQPIITICLERGGRGILAYGVNSNLCRLLNERDREQILSTIKQILEERKA